MGKVMTDSGTVFLGIDFGTGGCKISAVNAAGKMVAEAREEYVTEYAHPGWSEQNPADWFRAMCKALAELRKSLDFSKIGAVSFDGSTHNAVLLDKSMQPIRKTIMWTDQRSVDECAYLKAHCREKIFATAYQMPTPTWTLPQLMWLRNHEPEVLAKTEHILFVKDYVRFLVTGVAATDCIEAQGTLFFDMPRMTWSEELFALTGMKRSVLPELVKPLDQVGSVTPEAAAQTGLPAGIPVICGSSDSAVEDYGAGAIEPGDLILKLATAGNVNIMTGEAHPAPTTLTYSHIVPGMWYTVSATNAAALCERWFRDEFCGEEKRLAAQGGASAYNRMDALAAQSRPGAGGVMFHPYLQGERSPYWDADLRASFTGVSIASTRGDFLRAVLEGVSYSLLDCYGAIADMGLAVKRIFLIGGGARGELWSNIVSCVFNKPAMVPSPGDASYGSALLAAAGAGVFADAASAVRAGLKIDRELVPDPELAEFYQKEFQRYKNIHDALAPVYHRKG